MPDEIIEIEEKKPSKLKKILVIAAAVFLLLLIISYFVSPPGMFEMLAGLAESSKLKGNALTTRDDVLIIFNAESLAALDYLYDNNIGKEFKVCLKAEIVGKTYYVEETLLPETFTQEFNRVVSEPCPADYQLSLHTHPFSQCIASQADIDNFNVFKKENSNALLVIMCEKDRFNVYS